MIKGFSFSFIDLVSHCMCQVSEERVGDIAIVVISVYVSQGQNLLFFKKKISGRTEFVFEECKTRSLNFTCRAFYRDSHCGSRWFCPSKHWPRPQNVCFGKLELHSTDACFENAAYVWSWFLTMITFSSLRSAAQRLALAAYSTPFSQFGDGVIIS